MSKQNTYDAIIIGAGHNGLTAAAILARKGKNVCVLEASDTVGGMAKNVTLADGVTVPQIAHLAYNLNPTVLKELGVANKVKMKSLPTLVLSPDGQHISIKDGRPAYLNGEACEQAEEYSDIRTKLLSFAKLLAPLALRSPPDMSDGFSWQGLPEIAGLAKLGLNLKMMGKKDMREFLRIVLSNIYDLIKDEMNDGPLAGSLGADAIWGAWSGPRSPGTIFSLMYRYGVGGDSALPIGGMGAVCQAISDTATQAGTTIQCNSRVKSIRVEKDQVVGVTLSDGQDIDARSVLSSAGVLPTLTMAGVEHFDVEAVRRVRHVRSKGTTAKLNLVLSGVPDFKGVDPELLDSRIVIAPSLDDIERAFNAVKYGEIAQNPVMEILIPSLSDPSLVSETAPAGTQVMSVIIQYVPYYIEGGWTKTARNKLAKIVIDNLSEYAPGLKKKIIVKDILSPADIEAQTGAPGGHWHHCELTTDQLLTVRPVNGMSRYAFGVKGLYLCGASAHPGGDVSGTAGRNSARQLLKDGVLS